MVYSSAGPEFAPLSYDDYDEEECKETSSELFSDRDVPFDTSSKHEDNNDVINEERQILLESVSTTDLDSLDDAEDELLLDETEKSGKDTKVLNLTHLEDPNYAVVVLVSELPTRSSNDAVVLVRTALEKLTCKTKLDVTHIVSSFDSVLIKGGDVPTMRRLRACLPGFKTSWAHSFITDKSRICKIDLTHLSYVDEEFRRQIKVSLALMGIATLSEKWNAAADQLHFSVKSTTDLSKLDTPLGVEGQELTIIKPVVIIPQHPYQAILCFENAVSAQTMREVSKYLKRCCESKFTVWMSADNNFIFFVVEDWKETVLLLDNFDFRPSLSKNQKWRGPYLAIEFNDFDEKDHRFSTSFSHQDTKVAADILDMKQNLYVMQQSIRRSIEFRLGKMFRPIQMRLQEDTKQRTTQLDRLVKEFEAVKIEYEAKVVEDNKQMERTTKKLKTIEQAVATLSTNDLKRFPQIQPPVFGITSDLSANSFTFGKPK